MVLRGGGRKFGGIGVVVKRPMSGRGRGLMRLPSYLPRIKTRGAGRRRRRRRRCCGRRIRGSGLLSNLIGSIPGIGPILGKII